MHDALTKRKERAVYRENEAECSLFAYYFGKAMRAVRAYMPCSVKSNGTPFFPLPQMDVDLEKTIRLHIKTGLIAMANCMNQNFGTSGVITINEDNSNWGTSLPGQQSLSQEAGNVDFQSGNSSDCLFHKPAQNQLSENPDDIGNSSPWDMNSMMQQLRTLYPSFFRAN